MWIDIRECFLQLRALMRICLFQVSTWREIAIALIAVVFFPLVVFICLMANTHLGPKRAKSGK